MRISLTSTDSDLLQTIDVSPDLTLQDLTSLVEALLGEASFTLFFQAQPLINMQQTLTQLGIHEDDLIVIEKKKISTSPLNSLNTPLINTDDTKFEQFRQQILNDPMLQHRLQTANPILLQAAQQGKEPFFQLMTQLSSLIQSQTSGSSHLQALANSDPYDVEAQKKIEEAIRLEQVASNFELAMEHHPEAFGQVHMLYIPCEVNGVPVKALVDSGAQTTILSPSFAEKCGLMRLLDVRFQGTAKGVGTATILGRIHAAQMKLGNVYLMCSFTVMEGKHVDFLFGLDMLRRHQAILDLNKNVLCIQGESVPFLSENELPTLDSPSEPFSLSSTSSSSSSSSSSNPPIHSTTNTKPTSTTSNSSSFMGFGVPSSSSSSSSSMDPNLQTLLDMGATKEEAKKALEAAKGNLDIAASMLFQP